MTTTHDFTLDSDVELRVLQALKVRGFADAEAVADCTGFELAAVQAALQETEATGLTKSRTGRVSGSRLTPEGDARRDELLTARRESCMDALDRAYQLFLEPNSELKLLMTDWQMGDRSEADRGTALVKLENVHSAAEKVAVEATQADERFFLYSTRLGRAIERFRQGDPDALAKPMSHSYHDVWMELHEDLLTTMGRERSEADGH